MLKSFDIRVKSNHSLNWYDSFVVDIRHNRVTFNQCDARRNGQVARYFVITFFADGTAEVYAESAKGHRQEIFSTTQCLKLALRLLEETRSEARQVASVASSHEAANKVCKTFDVAMVVALVVLMIVATALGIEGLMEGADTVSIAPNFGVAILSAYLSGKALVKGATNNKD